MNFFRSEEHLHHWEGFAEKKRGGIISLDDAMGLFSGPYFKNRRAPAYRSHMGRYLIEMMKDLDKLENAGSFWKMRRFEQVGLVLAQRIGLL